MLILISPTMFCAEIREFTKTKGTSIWNFVCNSGLRKFRHGIYRSLNGTCCSDVGFYLQRSAERVRQREIYSPQANKRCDNQNNKLMHLAARANTNYTILYITQRNQTIKPNQSNIIELI